MVGSGVNPSAEANQMIDEVFSNTAAASSDNERKNDGNNTVTYGRLTINKKKLGWRLAAVAATVAVGSFIGWDNLFISAVGLGGLYGLGKVGKRTISSVKNRIAARRARKAAQAAAAPKTDNDTPPAAPGKKRSNRWAIATAALIIAAGTFGAWRYVNAPEKAPTPPAQEQTVAKDAGKTAQQPTTATAEKQPSAATEEAKPAAADNVRYMIQKPDGSIVEATAEQIAVMKTAAEKASKTAAKQPAAATKEAKPAAQATVGNPAAAPAAVEASKAKAPATSAAKQATAQATKPAADKTKTTKVSAKQNYQMPAGLKSVISDSEFKKLGKEDQAKLTSAYASKKPASIAAALADAAYSQVGKNKTNNDRFVGVLLANEALSVSSTNGLEKLSATKVAHAYLASRYFYADADGIKTPNAVNAYYHAKQGGDTYGMNGQIRNHVERSLPNIAADYQREYGKQSEVATTRDSLDAARQDAAKLQEQVRRNTIESQNAGKPWAEKSAVGGQMRVAKTPDFGTASIAATTPNSDGWSYKYSEETGNRIYPVYTGDNNWYQVGEAVNNGWNAVRNTVSSGLSAAGKFVSPEV